MLRVLPVLPPTGKETKRTKTKAIMDFLKINPMPSSNDDNEFWHIVINQFSIGEERNRELMIHYLLAGAIRQQNKDDEMNYCPTDEID